MITLKLYGDESADATKSRVFSVAGVLGADDEWSDAMRHWLRRTRGLPFHATDCESKNAKTDRAKHEENLKLYRDLTTILAESHLVGIAVSLDLKSQQQCLGDLPADIAYHKCFSDLLVNIGQITRSFNDDAEQPEDARVEFTFDSRLESDGTAGTIYTMYRTLPEWADTSIFDTTVLFDRDEPRLEVADLLAREAMKEFERKLTHARPEPRKSFQALDAKNKFIWIERDLTYCKEWRERVDSEQGKAGLEGYKQWLIETKRVQNGKPHDNMSNRALFYAWIEKRDALAKQSTKITG